MSLHAPAAGIIKKPFESLRDGRNVELYRLVNDSGMEAAITTYGGIVTSLTAADRNGRMDDVVLGFDNVDGYLAGHPYFGAIIGRYGNRIANGTFKLDGRISTLAKNNDGNHLHGGITGFDKALWSAQPQSTPEGPRLQLSHISAEGEEGYPGQLDVTVDYTLTTKTSFGSTTARPPTNLPTST